MKRDWACRLLPPVAALALFAGCTPAGEQVAQVPFVPVVETPAEGIDTPPAPAPAPAAALPAGPKPENGTLKINQITPAQALAGNEVIALIRGSGFQPWLKVRFGNVESQVVKVIDETMLTAVVPPQPPGAIDVVLRDDAGGESRLVGLQGGFTVMGESPPGTDSDGLPDDIETGGWMIEVDRFGFGLNPAHIIRYTVTSDPDLDDTDGDGLTDSEEYFIKCDPRNVDTDGDGLWDGEEVNRWDTSPVSVDSDGDASGAPAGSGISDAPPSASLFDGAELYDIASLALPPQERGAIRTDATSPSLDDTDGDGASDNDEAGHTVRTPLIADLPRLRARIVDAMDIRLDVEYGEESGQTTGYSSELSATQETTVGRSKAETQSHSVTVGTEVSASLTDFSVSVSTEVSVGSESTVETSRESTQSATQTYGTFAEDSRVKTETASTGSMSAGLEILNEGNISFKLTNLGMTVRLLQTNHNPLALSTPPEFSTLATLRPDLSAGLTLPPGGTSGVLQVTATEVNADRVKALLAKPEKMYLEPAAYEIENAEGINFAFIQEVTQARTARIVLDFGDGNSIDASIATNVNRNEDGSLAGLTLGNAMDQLVGEGNWGSRGREQQTSGVTPVTLNNGGFEAPQYPQSQGSPDNWTTNGAVAIWAGNSSPAPAPQGNQWLMLPADTYVYQQIGYGSDNAEYEFSFVQARQQLGNSVSIELWAYAPDSGVRIDSESFTLDDTSPSMIRTGRLAHTNGHNDQPLYLALRRSGGDASHQALIDNVTIQAYRATTPRVLWRVNNVQNELDSTPRMWLVYVNADNQSDHHFEDIVLHNNDAVIISLTADADGDGLLSTQEQHYGTSDANTDTDGDGLSDALETRGEYRVPAIATGVVRQGGWTVSVTGRAAYRAFSDPTRPDSDNDGLTDRQEYLGPDGIAPLQAGDHNDATDPLLADTDGDGILDGVDASLTPATVLYVKPITTGANNGSSWADAFRTLTAALAEARTRNSDGSSSNDVSEIWVAQAVYTPTAANTFFSLPPRVALYGGFSGGETRISQRNPDGVTNGTVLRPNGTDIMRATSPQQGLSVIDGFLLEGATLGTKALSITYTGTDSLLVANCFFYNNNTARPGGTVVAVGAVAGNGSANSITFEDCVFAGNRLTGTSASGGALLATLCQPTLSRCTFFGNTTDPTGVSFLGSAYGGAVAISNCPGFTVSSCRFEQNQLAAEGIGTAPGFGGALAVYNTSETVPSAGSIIGSVFRNNEVEPSLVNNVAGSWWAQRAGGGLAMSGSFLVPSAVSYVNVINCGFWQNRAQSFAGGAYVGSGTTGRFSNCTFNRNALSVTVVTGLGGSCGNGIIVEPFSAGAGIGALGTASMENCVLWGNVASASFRTTRLPVDQRTRLLGQERQASAAPSWADVTSGCIQPRGSVAFNNSCVEQLGVEAHFAGSVGGRANIGVDPLLANQDTGDLRLTDVSPCIDAGNHLIDVDLGRSGFQLLPLLDLAGNPRNVDGNGDDVAAVDMGAYEFQP